MGDRMIVISGDGHLGGTPEHYRDYYDLEYRHLYDEHVKENAQHTSNGQGSFLDRLTPEQLAAVDDEGAVVAGGEFGCWDSETRLRELDREGVAGEVLHAGPHASILPFFSVMNQPYPADVRVAGQRAYHRWSADLMAPGRGRLVGIADPGPCLDFDSTRKELTWCAEHHFRGVSLPQQVWDADLPAVHDPYYEPFWQICDDLDLVLSVHAGWGSPQGKFQEFVKTFVKNVVGMDESTMRTQLMQALASSADSPLKLDMGPRRVLWQLMLGGVFDRHPNLRVVLTEVRADWVPATLGQLDALHASGDTPLSKKPSEYFASNCFVTPSSPHLCEFEMRHEIGVDNFMFGTDYPHPEGTWPNTRDWINLSFGSLPEDEARKILGENAIRVYGLDRSAVEAAAQRIGPRWSDVQGDHSVPEARVKHFDNRAGFLRGPEDVDTDEVVKLWQQDLKAVTA